MDDRLVAFEGARESVTLLAPDARRETDGEGGALREEASEARLVNKGELAPSVTCCCWEDVEVCFVAAGVGEAALIEDGGCDPLETGGPFPEGAVVIAVAVVVDAPVLSALSRCCGLFDVPRGSLTLYSC